MGLLSGTTIQLFRRMAGSKRRGVSRMGAFLDHKTYKPYKGYNRLMSQNWNIKHTMK